MASDAVLHDIGSSYWSEWFYETSTNQPGRRRFLWKVIAHRTNHHGVVCESVDPIEQEFEPGLTTYVPVFTPMTGAGRKER